jgi:hypothetical protein
MNTKNLMAALVIPVLASSLAAQQPKAQALLMALGTNSKQLPAYQWKQKSTVVRKGSPVGFTIEEVRIDSGGKPQRLVIAKSEEKRLGPIAARKAESIKDSVQSAMRLVAGYANPQELADAIRKGELWEGPTGMRARARGVILPTDEVTIDLNAATYLISTVEVKTTHDGDPVLAFIRYQPLPNGPNMLMRMSVQVPGEDVVVQVESYDFVRLAASIVP